MSRQPVTIKKVNHPRYSWRVTFNQGKEYAQRYFVTKADAKSFADDKAIELLNEGRKHADFSDVERKAVIRCREMAESFAASGVKGFSLDAALTFYAAHLNLCGRSVKTLTAYDEFLEHKTKKKRSQLHLRNIRYRLEKFAKKHAKKLVAEITTKDIDAWLVGLNLSTQSQKNHRGLLHNFLGHCKDKGYCDTNPVTKSVKVTVDSKPPGILTPADTAAVLAAAPAKIVPALAIGFFAGLRTAEIIRLDWAQINLNRGFIEVTAVNAKNKKRRLVTIMPNLRAWLEPHAQLSGPVRPVHIRHQLNTARAESGVKWPPNACRHSFASYHLALNQDAAATSLQLGHSTTTVLFEHYRELAHPEDAASYFAITPAKVTPSNVLRMVG
jgi:integrase